MLLVPTTDCLIGSRDRESSLYYSDLVASEEFLGSHVLRMPISPGSANGKEESNVRDNRGKAKQLTTFNGRTVIIKENSVYSNKGGHKRITNFPEFMVSTNAVFTFRLQIPYSGSASLGCPVLYLVERISAMAHILHFAPIGRVVRSRQNHSCRSTRDLYEAGRTDSFRQEDEWRFHSPA